MKKFMFIPFVLLCAMFIGCKNNDTRILLYTDYQTYSSYVEQYITKKPEDEKLQELQEHEFGIGDLSATQFANNVTAFKNASNFKSEYMEPEQISGYLKEKFNISDHYAMNIATALLEQKHRMIIYRDTDNLYWIMK